MTDTKSTRATVTLGTIELDGYALRFLQSRDSKALRG
jgi:hypothetical protein